MFPSNPFLSAVETFVDSSMTLYSQISTDMSQSTNGEVTVSMTGYLSPPPSKYGYFSLKFSYDVGSWQEIEMQRDMERLGEDELEGMPDVALLIEASFEFPQEQDLDLDDLCLRLKEVAFDARAFGQFWPDSFVEKVTKHSSRSVQAGGSEVNERVRVGFEAFMPLSEIHSRDWTQMAKEWYDLACDLAETGVGERPPAATELW